MLILLLSVGLFLASCTVMIPMETSLYNKILYQAENKNIKANYTIKSNIVDGYIPYVHVKKNGKEKYKNSSYTYDSSTAFTKLWGEYFSKKFNAYASETIDIEVTLIELKLRDHATTSIGLTFFTGYSELVVEAMALLKAVVVFRDRKYETQFEVTSSDYSQSMQIRIGDDWDDYYNITVKDPTLLKAEQLHICLNESIIQFENFLSDIILADKE